MTWIVALLALMVFVVLEWQTARPDGTLLSVHPYRRVMWFIMRRRNESVVYWDFDVDVDKLLAYLDEAKASFGATPTHAIVAAVGKALHEHPKMNRFVSGKRLYERKGAWISFSMKRVRMDKEAKLAVVKQEFTPGMTFQELCAQTADQIVDNRSGRKTYADKELGLFHRLPRLVFDVAHRAFVLADYYNLLPASFIRNDPMFSSVFISNLGSMGIEAGYHHLYEWGNCPIFLMIGKVEDRAVRDGDSMRWVKSMRIRVTFDERINDGLSAFRGVESIKRILEDPYTELGTPTVRPE
jgi:hypothetical protein